jgi:hypothetical protein
MTITGKITDQTGAPLMAAAIYESNEVGILKGAGTTSDENGLFELEAQNAGATFFTIRYLGFQPITLKKNESYFLVEMAQSSFDLPPVTIRPGQPGQPVEKKTAYWIYGALLLAFLFLNRKR